MYSTLQQYVDDAKQAGNAGAWYAALALVLALPDICSAVGYRGSPSAARYIAWFDKYAAPKICSNVGPVIDGNAAYALRCEFLHSGTGEISRQRSGSSSRLDKVVLTESFGVTSAGVRKQRMAVPGSKEKLALPVGDLCENVLLAVSDWYQDIVGDPSKLQELDELLKIMPVSTGPDGT